jgi:peptide/nickel transport system permease protein
MNGFCLPPVLYRWSGFFLDTVRMLGLAFGITIVVFFLIRVIPGDVVDLKAVEGGLNEKDQAELRREMGLDKPMMHQFWIWVKSQFKGDLGISLRYVRPVKDLILHALPTTLRLAFYSLSLGLMLGVGVAVGATLFPQSFLVWLVNLINIWSIALPTFCLGVVGILIFSIGLGWMPTIGNMLLPTIIIGIDVAGQIVKPLHEDLKESATSNFVRTARAKGLHPVRIVLFHILPNSLTVVLALAGIILAGLVNGSITMEVLFGLPGMGTLALSAIKGRDYPVVQTVVLYLALSVVFANFITDTLQRLVDPRLRK